MFQHMTDRVGSGRGWLGILLGCISFHGNVEAGLPAPWRFVNPWPQGNDLLAVWAPGPDQLYAGGHGGVILHWNGAQWVTMATPTQKTIFALHGTSATDIWAVGGDPYTDNVTNRCLILRFDGTSWKEQAAPQFSGYTYSLNAVHAVAANDVWATQDNGTFLAHFDGKQWEFVTVPLDLEGTLKAVTSVGPDHLYVAGTHGQILHRDHGVWKREQKLETGGLTYNHVNLLWAYDAEHVFAAGNWTQFYRRQPDGSWESLPVGASEPFGINFLGLWGRSPTEVYLMGADSVYHYDGVQPAVRTSLLGMMRRQWLRGCGAGDRLYGVGPAGVVHEYALTGPATGVLSPLSVGRHDPLPRILRGATAMGTEGVVVYGSALWQTGGWPWWYAANGCLRRMPSLPPGATAAVELTAVLARGEREVFVAWANWDDGRRGVHRWDGDRWTAMPGAEGAVAFWQSPAGRLYAAGATRVTHWNGSDAWVTTYTASANPPGELTALWGRTDNDVFVGTRDGQILRFDGNTWKAETTPGEGKVVGLAGTATDTYAVGEHGLAWRRVGAAWQPLAKIAARNEEHFSALTAAADGVYAAQRTPAQFVGGGLGRVWRFQGADASLVVQGLSQPIEVLTRTGAGHLVGVAANGVLLTTAPAPAGLAVERVSLATEWEPVGGSGLSLRAETPLASRPLVGVQRVVQPVPLAVGPVLHGEHWLWLGDRWETGSALPPLLVRLEYNPAALPPEWGGQPLGLVRYAEAVTEVAAQWDPVAQHLSSAAPVEDGLWTVGRATIVPPPALTVTQVAGSALALSWPATAEGWVLQAALEVGEGADWVPVTETPALTGDQKVLTVTVDGHARFFRLRAGGP
jgi:hypothetical protein